MTSPGDDDHKVRLARFGRLPDHVALEDTTTTQDGDPPTDPTKGRDLDHEFMIRHAPG